MAAMIWDSAAGAFEDATPMIWDEQAQAWKDSAGLVYDTSKGAWDERWNKNLLPNAYQAVEYIQSSGAQLINTNYYGNATGYKFRTKVMLVKFPSTEGYAIFGSCHTDGNFQKVLAWNNGTWQLYWYSNYNGGYFGKYKLNTEYVIEYSNVSNVQEILVNGSMLKSATEKTRAASIPFTIMGQYWSGSVDTNVLSCIKMYFFEIYEGDVMVHNFIPCYRKSDNIAGMYDVVEKQFYSNEINGSNFAVGAEI